MMQFIYFVAIAAILFVGLRFSCGDCVMGRGGVASGGGLPLIALGWALSLFLALTYLVCVGFDLLFPDYAMHRAWAELLPGFVWLTPVGFVVGLVESFLYGWYVALLFGGLYNAIVARTRAA